MLYTLFPGSRRHLVATGIAALAIAGTAWAQTAPQPPQVFLQTDPVAPVGRSITVSAGGSLQAALDGAQAGDVILLQAGATFLGPFRLPNKAGSGWITVRTAAADAQLPAAGQRITPAYASVLPKIVTAGSGPALTTDRGAHHFRFVGVEFSVAAGVALNYGIIALGDATDTSVSQLPNNLIFDRVYVHGGTTGNVRRGIAMNSASTAVIDSYVSEIHEVGADSQAIASWNGTGPFKIVNNYLEAAGENVLFGGADPTIPNLVPSDIEVRRNLLSKPRKWRIGDAAYAGIAWSVKNLFELKNAQRVLIEGNQFEYNWPHAQNGFSILFTVRNQDGAAPWSVVQDVTFVNNLVQHVSSAINILGRDNLQSSQQTRRVRIANNLFTDVGGTWGGGGRLLQVLDGAGDIIVEHNTALQSGDVVVGSGEATSGFAFRNNLAANGPYGVGGDGTFGNPQLTLATFFPNAVFVGNALVGAAASSYPAGNFFPSSFAAVGFVDQTRGDYHLSATSPYRNAGTDGRDVGVDVDALIAAMHNTAAPLPDGGGGGGGGADTTPPTVSLTSPGTNTTASGTVTLVATASDNVGVVGVSFTVDGAQVGAEATAAPYTAPWNTASVNDGTHVLRADARDGAGNVTSSSSITVVVANSTGPPPTVGQTVVWTRLRNATSAPGSLTKAGGCDGCPDAGGSSVQAITSGLGHLEFVVASTTTQYVIGLSHGDTDTSERDVDFALKFWPGGTADVRANGAYQRSETQVVVGDVFRVAVTANNIVTFSRNGVPFHQIKRKVTYPLVADVSLSSAAARVLGAAVTGAPVAAPAATPVVWTQMMNVDLVGGVLTKIAGCDGCQDGGAVSSQAISTGAGYVEFSAPDSLGQRVIGLSGGNSGTTEADIDFGLKFWVGGSADVRENGAYVGVETGYAATDVFRVAVAAGAVTYFKNGQVLYRSTRTPTSTLLVDTSFSTLGGRLSGIVISGAN